MRQTLLHRLLIVLLLAALLPALVPTPASALMCAVEPPRVVIWTGEGDGSTLTQGANWDGGVVPTSGQTACIPGQFANDTLVKSGSGTFEVAVLQSSAPILVSGGTLQLAGDSLVEGAVSVNGGHVRIDANLALGQGVPETMRLLNGGRLSGTGSLDGHLLNFSGIVAPGTPEDPIDDLTLARDFIQASDGRIAIQIAEVDGLLHDQIVMGEVTPQLDGFVQVTRTGTLPALGDTFVIVDTSSSDVTQSLEVIDGTIGDGRSFEVSTQVDPFGSSNDVVLTAIQEPPPLEVSLSDIQVEEGDDGTTDVDITATLNRTTTTDVDVTVQVSEVNSTQGSDFSRAAAFTQTQAVIKIPAGDTAASVALEIIGDGDPEPDETIEVTILTVNPASVQTGQDTATVTIVDDDEPLPLDDPSLAPTSFPDTCLVDTEGPGLIKDEPLSAAQIALGTVDCADPAGVGSVLIGRDDDFADSLSSGFLQQDAPLLLVPGGGPVPPAVIATLQRLAPQEIIIMGGEAAVGSAVEQELTDLGIAVVRRDGPTRIETAIDVAATDATDATTAIIARAFPGDGDPTQAFADAIAAGGMAADLGLPILLTDTAQLSGNTASYLRGSSITDVYIMGGTAAVSSLTESQIAEIIPGTVTRVAGDSRFGTSVEVAKERGSQSAADVAQLIMVEGQGEFAWAGGLTAAYQAAQDDAPIVLLNGGEVPPETAAYLTPNAGFAVDLVDVDDGALTCAGRSDGCLEARRLLGMNGTTVTFDPPSLSPAVPGQQIAVSFADQLPASADVVYGGSCLRNATTQPEAITIRDDAGGPPLPCLVTVTITYDSGVVQTSVAAYR